MGIGEAAVTILSEDGVPTPVVHTRLRAPASRMGPADDVDAAARASPLFAKYGTRTEAESAREKLAARLEEPEPEPAGSGARGARRGRSGPAEEARRISRRRRKEAATATTGGGDVLGDFLRSREGKTIGRKVARGVFGMLRKRL
ncbi:MAG TPA: helicase HerA-like domain-containing protein, partial [Thermoleophilaceae bacterium]|nr:helicase HerA-like domain-containing protein [Thermoleophilaceae bacterium]